MYNGNFPMVDFFLAETEEITPKKRRTVSEMTSTFVREPVFSGGH
jgi:hypothetical protein